jgi:hypothetical protein
MTTCVERLQGANGIAGRRLSHRVPSRGYSDRLDGTLQGRTPRELVWQILETRGPNPWAYVISKNHGIRPRRMPPACVSGALGTRGLGIDVSATGDDEAGGLHVDTFIEAEEHGDWLR